MNLYLITALTLFNYTAFKGSKMLTALFAIELGASQALIGVIYAIHAIFPIFLAMHAGKLGDRLGYRLPIVLGTAGLVVGVLLPWLLPTLWGLALSTAMLGMSLIFFSVCSQAAVGHLPGDRAKNYATQSLGNAASAFLGPMMVGFSIDGQGHQASYLLVAAMPAAGLLLLLLRPSLVPKGRKAEKKERVGGTLGMLKETPSLRRILIAGATTEAALELYTFYMPIYGHSVGLSASEIGVVMGMYAVAMVAIRLLSPCLVRRLGEETVLRLSMLVAAAVYCAFPFFSRMIELGILALVLGFSLGACVPLTQTIISMRAPSERSGEAMGARHTLNKTIGLTAPLLYATLGALVGAMPIYWSCAAALVAGNNLVSSASKRIFGRRETGVAADSLTGMSKEPSPRA